MKTQRFLVLVLGVLGCSKPQQPSLENFTRGMNTYLQKRGDLCLGKTTWPIGVTDREAAAGQRDGVQMPVLERLGLVQSVAATLTSQGEDGPATEKGRSYQLTEAGRRYYVVRPTAGRDGLARDQGDFCPVKLSLDKIMRFELEPATAGAGHAVVSYRYRVSAPDWMKDADAERVFPAVARVIAGAGAAELQEGFTLTSSGWVANDLLVDAAMPAAPGEKVARRP